AALNSLRGEWSPEVGRGDSKHPSLPLARAERKPFDRKRKPAPRHRRENQLKEKTSSTSGPRGAQSHLTERKTSPAPPAREESLVLFFPTKENYSNLKNTDTCRIK
ncbi:MAG: hypothetical protein KHX18_08205, partial [Faecalibacterium prausnitzii]|nr:hypothetical protein [Faecalibacterium prausnitzii]